MSRNLGAVPTPRRLRTISDPQLVVACRRLAKDQVIWKLKNGGTDSPTAYLYREALAEAARRKLTIHPPELVDGHPPEGG